MLASRTPVVLPAASAAFDEVVKLEETLRDLKGQFRQLQLEDMARHQSHQQKLFARAQKVSTSQVGQTRVLSHRSGCQNRSRFFETAILV